MLLMRMVGQPCNMRLTKGNTAMTQLLLGAQAAVDAAGARGCTALLRAAYYGHAAVAQLLLGARAAVNVADAAGLTALHIAASKGRVAVVQLLLGAQDAVATDVIAGAAGAAAAAGHSGVAVALFKALMARDSAAAAAPLETDQSLAAAVL
jgi:ankyrin repeat protein